jgi:putative transposase
MLRTHRIRLVPTSEQEELFRKSCGVARFAYNWGLAEWERRYQAGERVTEVDLRRELNAVKGTQFPWMLEVSKNVPQQALKNLGRAYKNFFSDIVKYERGEMSWQQIRRPTPSRKRRHDSFRADPGTWKLHPNAVVVDGKKVCLPRIGWVKMRESLRFSGRISSAVVSRSADRWFVSLAVDDPNILQPTRLEDTVAGVDLGLIRLATVSDGSIFEFPQALKHLAEKTGRLTRNMHRKRLGSKNFAKAKTKLARFYLRSRDVRRDALHKLTTWLVSRFSTIGIEDLNVAGMLKLRALSKRVSDAGFFEFRRQLQYKAEWYGSRVVVADRFFPSSKMCSACGFIEREMNFSTRWWTCSSCRVFHDRDLNAARNLARIAESSPVIVCGAGGSGGAQQHAVKPPRRSRNGAETRRERR